MPESSQKINVNLHSVESIKALRGAEKREAIERLFNNTFNGIAFSFTLNNQHHGKECINHWVSPSNYDDPDEAFAAYFAQVEGLPWATVDELDNELLCTFGWMFRRDEIDARRVRFELTPSANIAKLVVYKSSATIRQALDTITRDNAKHADDWARLRALGADGAKAKDHPHHDDYVKLKTTLPKPMLVTADPKDGKKSYASCAGAFNGLYALDYDRDNPNDPDDRDALLADPHFYAITKSAGGLGAGVFVVFPEEVTAYINTLTDKAQLSRAWEAIVSQLRNCAKVCDGIDAVMDPNSNNGVRLRFVCDEVRYNTAEYIRPYPLVLSTILDAVAGKAQAQAKATKRAAATKAEELDAKKASEAYASALEPLTTYADQQKKTPKSNYLWKNVKSILFRAEQQAHSGKSRHDTIRDASHALIKTFTDDVFNRSAICAVCYVLADRIGFERDQAEIDRMIDDDLAKIGSERGQFEAFKDVIEGEDKDIAIAKFFKAFDADYLLGDLDEKTVLVNKNSGKIYKGGALRAKQREVVARYFWEMSDGTVTASDLDFGDIMYNQDAEKFCTFVTRPDYIHDRAVSLLSSGFDCAAEYQRIYLINGAKKAPQQLPYTSDDVANMITMLCWVAERFDTPDEARWALSYLLCKARFGTTYRPHTALYLVDDGSNNDGGRRGKSLVAEGLLTLLYGKDRGAIGTHAHGIRAEENFDGDENLKLFHVVNELNMGKTAQERDANFEGLKDFITNDWYQLRQKGRDAQTVKLATLLCITSNGAKGLRVNASIRARLGLFGFSRDVHDYYDDVKDTTLPDDLQEQSTVNDAWLTEHIYHYLGVNGDKPVVYDVDGSEDHDNAPELARMRAALFAFAKTWAGFADVGKDVNMETHGAALAAAQAAQDNPKEDAVLDVINEAGGLGILQTNIASELRKNGVELSGQAVARIVRGLSKNGLIEACGTGRDAHDNERPKWRATKGNSNKARVISLKNDLWRAFRDEIGKAANALFSDSDIPENDAHASEQSQITATTNDTQTDRDEQRATSNATGETSTPTATSKAESDDHRSARDLEHATSNAPTKDAQIARDDKRETTAHDEDGETSTRAQAQITHNDWDDAKAQAACLNAVNFAEITATNEQDDWDEAAQQIDWDDWDAAATYEARYNYDESQNQPF